jgi:hypothetical protein
MAALPPQPAIQLFNIAAGSRVCNDAPANSRARTPIELMTDAFVTL